MAREITTTIWCDVCLGRDDLKSPGMETAPVAVGRNKPRIAALCDEHHAIYDDFVNLLNEFGQIVPEGGPIQPKIPGTAPKKTGRPSIAELTCPDKECGHQAPNKSALASHVRHMHGTTLGELLGEPLPFTCPECDRAFTAPQGLAAHRRTTHGITAADTKAAKAKETAKAK